MSDQQRRGFWREAFAIQGWILPEVLPQVAVFGMTAAALCWLSLSLELYCRLTLAVEVAPHELAGAVLSLLLVFRTNAGYERWWEARKLWGGFVDRTRNLIISAMSYGPDDAIWREQVAIWTAAYAYVARNALRREPPGPEVVALLGPVNAERIAKSEHMPSCVAMKLAALLREACEQMGTDRFVFLQLDRERALLIDNFGGCERIVNTPMPMAYSIKIRHFIVMFLLTLPFALLHRLGNEWLVPVVTMLVAYPLLSLDQLGVELENPFTTSNLSHLPLDGIATAIEGNVLAIWKAKQRGES